MCTQRNKLGRASKRLAVILGSISIFHSGPALAYLDPGTGSIILQGLLAAFAMIAAAGSMFWRRIKETISSLFSRKGSPPGEPTRDPES